MPRLLSLYLLTALVFFAVDLLWLGIVAVGFYRRQMGDLMRPDVRWDAAIAFYAIYLIGILVFAVLPGLDAGSLGRTVALGAFFGFVAYATFDLTALAVIRGFPGGMVVVDLIWGTVLTGTVAAAGYGFGRWLGIGVGA
jgi:uncharacterized membrane protein